MLEVLRRLVEQTKRLEKMILQYVRQDQVCRLFMTIPGVGPLTALAYKTFVDGHERFKNSRDVYKQTLNLAAVDFGMAPFPSLDPQTQKHV
jgi:transposase